MSTKVHIYNYMKIDDMENFVENMLYYEATEDDKIYAPNIDTAIGVDIWKECTMLITSQFTSICERFSAVSVNGLDCDLVFIDESVNDVESVLLKALERSIPKILVFYELKLLCDSFRHHALLGDSYRIHMRYAITPRKHPIHKQLQRVPREKITPAAREVMVWELG